MKKLSIIIFSFFIIFSSFTANINVVQAAGEKIECSDFNYEDDQSGTKQTLNILTEVFGIIMIAGPILALVLGSLDFAKATLASDADALKKAGNNFVKRLIAAGLLLIIPLIVNFVISVAADAGIFTSGVPLDCIK